MARRREVPEDERIYINEAAELLDRRMGTLRKWEAMGSLPVHLRPQRGRRNWRYWTPQQIEGIKEWIQREDRQPGRGLPHIAKRNADPHKVQQQIHAMRQPRKKKNDK